MIVPHGMMPVFIPRCTHNRLTEACEAIGFDDGIAELLGRALESAELDMVDGWDGEAMDALRDRWNAERWERPSATTAPSGAKNAEVAA